MNKHYVFKFLVHLLRRKKKSVKVRRDFFKSLKDVNIDVNVRFRLAAVRRNWNVFWVLHLKVRKIKSRRVKVADFFCCKIRWIFRCLRFSMIVTVNYHQYIHFINAFCAWKVCTHFTSFFRCRSFASSGEVSVPFKPSTGVYVDFNSRFVFYFRWGLLQESDKRCGRRAAFLRRCLEVERDRLPDYFAWGKENMLGICL